MKPTEKAPEIEKLLTDFAGISRQDAADQQICTFCKQSATSFRDSLSEKEYRISGMCQECQDKVFGV